MARPKFEHIRRPSSAIAMAMDVVHTGAMPQFKGEFILDLKDAKTGKTLVWWKKPNIITLDAGILVARLLKDSLSPNPAQNNGLTMLGVGTGATGAPFSPDAPQNTQRKLNTEVERKAFSNTTFRTSGGVAVNYPTNIVDYETAFTTAEAVGSLNEMGLMSTISLNPLVSNAINNGTGTGTAYDATIDTSALDLMANYLTFPVVSKNSSTTLTLVWRLTA